MAVGARRMAVGAAAREAAVTLASRSRYRPRLLQVRPARGGVRALPLCAVGRSRLAGPRKVWKWKAHAFVRGGAEQRFLEGDHNAGSKVSRPTRISCYHLRSRSGRPPPNAFRSTCSIHRSGDQSDPEHNENLEANKRMRARAWIVFISHRHSSTPDLCNGASVPHLCLEPPSRQRRQPLAILACVLERESDSVATCAATATLQRVARNDASSFEEQRRMRSYTSHQPTFIFPARSVDQCEL